MSYEPLLSVHRVLPDGGPQTFTSDESRALLEVAFLATEADDVLAEEEIVAFRDLARTLAALAGKTVPEAGDIAQLRNEFAVVLDRETRKERIAALAKTLERPLAKETAYKIALAVGMCDFSSSAAEGDFEEDLLDALGIDDDNADRLAAQVYDAIGDDEDEDDDDLDDEDEDEDDEEEEAGDA